MSHMVCYFGFMTKWHQTFFLPENVTYVECRNI